MTLFAFSFAMLDDLASCVAGFMSNAESLDAEFGTVKSEKLDFLIV
jgi:hypothetical protein